MASTVRSRARRVLREAARDIADGTYPYELYVAQHEEGVPDAPNDPWLLQEESGGWPWISDPYIWVDTFLGEAYLAIRWRTQPGRVYCDLDMDRLTVVCGGGARA